MPNASATTLRELVEAADYSLRRIEMENDNEESAVSKVLDVIEATAGDTRGVTVARSLSCLTDEEVLVLALREVKRLMFEANSRRFSQKAPLPRHSGGCRWGG